MGINIRLASDREIESVFRFRYEVYVSEMGRSPHDADHVRRTITDELDSHATIFIAYDGTEIVGTMRQHFGTIRSGFYADFYGMRRFAPLFPERCSVTSKLMVRPDLRGTSLGVRLCKCGYEAGIERGMRFDFIDSNPPLLPLYQRFGYRQFLAEAPHPDYGMVHRLVLDYEDRAHLQRVRSPFASMLPEDRCPPITLTDMLERETFAAA
jgi:predicted N-acetyltransferase YhbS